MIDFDGTDDRVTLPTSTSDHSFSVAFWKSYGPDTWLHPPEEDAEKEQDECPGD